MLTYNIENRGDMPIYVYLYDCIKADIESGVLRADERLPSKRRLAGHLQVSVITVENAYAQLLAEGYIYSLEKRGYFVSTLERGSAGAAVSPVKPREREKEKYFCDFKSGGVDPERFPFSTWARLMRQVIAEQNTNLLSSVPHCGVESLREMIAWHLYRFRGMRVSPECIVVGAGGEYLYGLILQLLGAGTVCAVENPGYIKIAKIYEANGAVCRYIPMDGSGISVEALEESGANVVHISPSHHFPLGLVTPVKRRQELIAWANRAPDRFIIEDDYDSEFRFSGRPIPSLQSIDVSGRVIYMNTFTKTLAPSIRIGFMVLPPTLIQKFRERLGFYACTVSAFEQYTLAKFIGGGWFERHINRMRTAYRAQRDRLIDELKKRPIWNIAEISGEESGLHFLLRLKTNYSDAELIRRCAENGIRAACLSEFDGTRTGGFGGTLVISYSGVEYDKIPRAAELLSRAVCGE